MSHTKLGFARQWKSISQPFMEELSENSEVMQWNGSIGLKLSSEF